MRAATSVTSGSAGRLEGLDLARFIAFVGMVMVNFAVVTGAPETALSRLLEGRAAATFVVLAGIGLGLAGRSATRVVWRRAAFLLALGLVNSLIFDADILHYYALYFAIGALFLGAPLSRLVIAIAAANAIFVLMLLTLNYDLGWDWTTYTYHGFWSVDGFVRNLFFNGWHPVFPWVGFLLFGVALSRLRLDSPAVQRRLILWGLAALAAAEGVAWLLRWLAECLGAAGDPEIATLLTTAPVPPMPLYTVAGMGAAALVSGLCLRAAARWGRAWPARMMLPAGRQTLTLYVAHILLGMGALEALGLIHEGAAGDGAAPGVAVFSALLFCAAAAACALVWSRLFRRGPLEALMRRVAG